MSWRKKSPSGHGRTRGTARQPKQSGLVERRTADWIALIVFALILVACLIFIGNTKIPSFPTTTTTTKTISQTVQGSNGFARQRRTIEKTTSDVVPPLWQSLVGAKAPLIFFFAAALFIAFLLATITQRVLLGQYNFSIGPLTVPEITRAEVKEATGAALAAMPSEAHIAATEGEKEPIWATIDDPNLALAGWRIDLEKEATRIADEFHIPIRERPSLRRTLISLSQNGAIERNVIPGLIELLDLANRGVHGAPVDHSVIGVLRDEGDAILRYLRSIHG